MCDSRRNPLGSIPNDNLQQNATRDESGHIIFDSLHFPTPPENKAASANFILIRAPWLAGRILKSSRKVPQSPRDYLSELESVISNGGTIVSVRPSEVESENMYQSTSITTPLDRREVDLTQDAKITKAHLHVEEVIQELQKQKTSSVCMLQPKNDPIAATSDSESCGRDIEAGDTGSQSSCSDDREKLWETAQPSDKTEFLPPSLEAKEIYDAARKGQEAEKGDFLHRRQILIKKLISKHSSVFIPHQDEVSASLPEFLQVMYEKIEANRKQLKELDQCAEMIESSLNFRSHNTIDCS
uniref:AlNc14C95G5821 protein n=1 Tax=Albugo laibachii Nc14 TaxID=890382 RepID=F0WGU4_9STRA|nr:AlNc14C95G5821 [Albugo laibachii Nc14]|eukprot:CCA20459.1 AlNc14C95G5821 [Albugo laibachii Nc14]